MLSHETHRTYNMVPHLKFKLYSKPRYKDICVYSLTCTVSDWKEVVQCRCWDDSRDHTITQGYQTRYRNTDLVRLAMEYLTGWMYVRSAGVADDWKLQIMMMTVRHGYLTDYQYTAVKFTVSNQLLPVIDKNAIATGSWKLSRS